MADGWIGVDFDGTLAHYDERHSLERIGEPCAPMWRRVRQWIENGTEVRIVTARGGDAALTAGVERWLRENNLPALPVTNQRDTAMLQLWDDRAVQLEGNSGKILTPKPYVPLVPAGWVGVELDGVLAEAAAPQSLLQLGAPIPAMINRVKQWQMVGLDVRVFSGRAAHAAQLSLIEQWLAAQGLHMVVTAVKDFQMSVFYDARAVHVVHNSGEPSLSPEDKLSALYA